MKVYFDPQIFLTQRVGGVSRYFFNLKRALADNGLCQVDNWSFVYRNSYIGSGNGAVYIKPLKFKKLDELIGTSTGLRYLGMLNEAVALQRFRSKDCDIIHVTEDNANYITNSRLKKPVVATVHDLIPELFPSHFPAIRPWLKQRENIFKKADHLICISESTKKDLKNIYAIPDDKISMVYHGPADYIVKKQEFVFLKDDEASRQKYVLYIGDRKTPYKNFMRMLEHLAPVLKENDELKLLCVGAPFRSEEKIAIAKFGLTKLVDAVQAHDDELFSIYEQAECLILPSLYEGFGFPLLEAMKAGCLILSSNTSSLPEVGGAGALYFDPVSFEGFAENIKRLLTDKKLQSQQRINQGNCLKKFSWTYTARQTFHAYQTLAPYNSLILDTGH
jgi:glycosyltransferase involved in cell wall biosynthesis